MANFHVPDVWDIYTEHKALTCIAVQPYFSSLPWIGGQCQFSPFGVRCRQYF